MEDINFLHKNYNEEVNSNNVKVIIVEDDKILGLSLKKYLDKTLNMPCDLFTTSEECLKFMNEIGKEQAFCLITDISLEEGADGLILIDVLKERGHKFVSIAMTGFASIETAIAATKKGVFQYLTKPFELENLKNSVLAGLESKLGIKLDSSSQSNAETMTKHIPTQTIGGKYKIELPKAEDKFCGMIGRSQAMKKVFDRIQKVSSSDSTVLITGPSGTGKELVAMAIHQLSNRKTQNKISVNCGAIPGELLESELFGHIKGAFTGAISTRKGRFELANNGTIFLDEIGDMPLLLQVKLLRVIQTRQLEPVGGSEVIDINVRIIAATHRDLEKEVNDGKFREDLYYRLNVIPIQIPALKERREDIPVLIGHFLQKFVSADGSNKIEFSDESLEMLLGYDWPGNVRELENVIERLVILRGGSRILPEDLPAKIFRHNPLRSTLYKTIFELPEEGVDLKRILSDIEDSLILQALDRTLGNKNQASRLLKLNRTTLIEKMKKKNIDNGSTDLRE